MKSKQIFKNGKRGIFIFMLAILMLAFVTPNTAQVKVDAKGKVEKETNQRANQKADQAIDKSFNKLEEGIGKLFGKKKKKNKNKTKTNQQDQQIVSSEQEAQQRPQLNWAKYDFVPGDKIIFEDNLIDEENGEFPSRWDLIQGNVEIAQLGGENVIMFRAGSPGIIPYLKDPKKDYLPDIFTIEFDLYCGDGTFEVNLYDRKNQKSGSPSGYTQIKINNNQMGWTNSYSEIPDQSLPKRRWVHIAIAYTRGKLKAYHDETRLINVPRIDFDPKGLTLYTYIFGTLHEGHYYVKNVRIAEGGVKYYDRFLQDGKIVTHGIRFDVNKAVIKPESMGVINSIYKILKDNSDLKFSIEGHTDSDGNDANNQTLSENRAQSVMNMFTKMGISANRLSFKGFGESKPIADNSSAEGKANNRRVEFVKSN